MAIPWSCLGLTAFVLVAEERKIVCFEGRPVPSSRFEPIDSLPHLAFAGAKMHDRTEFIDLHLFAQVLLPRLSDHRPVTLASFFGAPLGDDPSDVLCAVLQYLLGLALTRDPVVCQSLGRLVGGPTGDMLERCAMHSSAKRSADAQPSTGATRQPSTTPPTVCAVVHTVRASPSTITSIGCARVTTSQFDSRPRDSCT